ncbi:MAG: exonuclease domain-containing protein, partial [Geminicoccaceae bacterium]
MFKGTEPHQSVLPLNSLDAIVFDTETTGLDTASNHIVQIGAVRLASGRIERAGIFDELVDPGVPIPEKATAIHGISDEDVANAPNFAAIMPAFAAWAGRHIVLGYSIGFDLAMLKAEHDRAGLSWQRPRGLDIAHLVQLLSPKLPSTSLDTVAAWLGIEIRNRHQALGDALLAAEIYLALLPRLRSKGVFTLAEAERSCLALTSNVEKEAWAGWQGAVAPRAERSQRQIDSFPYRHRLYEIAHSPPVTIAHGTSVKDALRQMMLEQVSSVYVLPP